MYIYIYIYYVYVCNYIYNCACLYIYKSALSTECGPDPTRSSLVRQVLFELKLDCNAFR